MRRVAWSTAQRRVEDLLVVEWSVRSRGRGHQHLRRCVESCQFFAQLAGAGDAALANPNLAGCVHRPPAMLSPARWTTASTPSKAPAVNVPSAGFHDVDASEVDTARRRRRT